MPKLVDLLATLEHEQWIKWAQSLMDTENLSPKRIERWKKYMVPYVELDEKTKDYDRKWAREVIKLFMRCGIMPICDDAATINKLEAEAKYEV